MTGSWRKRDGAQGREEYPHLWSPSPEWPHLPSLAHLPISNLGTVYDFEFLHQKLKMFARKAPFLGAQAVRRCSPVVGERLRTVCEHAHIVLSFYNLKNRLFKKKKQ